MERTLYDSDHYPGRAGSKRAGTSRQAAEQIDAGERKQETYVRIAWLLELNPDGLTADEIADQLHEHLLYVRPRCSEMKSNGLIEACGAKRRNVSGKWADVLVLAGDADTNRDTLFS